MWDKTTNALDKTHVWKNTLAKKAKNYNAKWKSRPSRMCTIAKKERQPKKKCYLKFGTKYLNFNPSSLLLFTLTNF